MYNKNILYPTVYKFGNRSFVRVFNSNCYAVVNEYCTFKDQPPVNLFVW